VAIYRAKCWLGSSSGYQELEVKSSTLYGAKEQFRRIYGAEQIINLREVRDDSSSSGSDVSGGASVVGAGLLAACFAFVYFTPWVLMLFLGGFATWVGEVITGQSLEEYTQRNDDFGHKRAALVVVLALLAGGFGFVKGDEIKKGFDAPDTPAEVKKAQ
jgi:hypothetical protein